MNPFHLRICILALLALLGSALCGCEQFQKNITVTWFDTDGTCIETAEVSGSYDPNTRDLPEDTDLWHYTGWTVSKSGNVTVCTAVRVARTRIVWEDHDGTVLAEQFILEGDPKPERDFPPSSPGWVYTKWDETEGTDQITYRAQREPDLSYFTGNVFQIVVNDAAGNPLGVGSGFVFHKNGWFITNDHVMKDAHSAQAYFDIKDSVEGNRYTILNILGGVYHDEKKDVFVGKLEGYEKLADHFQDIAFTEEYTQGDVCYSVGYPNSSVTMEINKGTVQEEYSNIYDKIDGKYYILSDCYIAPGSSGGILVNEDFQVIGITTMGLYSDESKTEYVSGGSIPTYIFIQRTKDLRASDIQPLTKMYGAIS